ncbi:DUF308 domain-containing protein [Peribacillus glennii]|uniref:DUF308 domain-containing protein n=2 Tax=Peribacillus glennii TaxID=2303991 RepID=A0A372LIH8_9BACI|nr:DUF308 domain-containing protein [Peribacillus glennii]RFU66090.1 DUF308 domain-containing protein [Peribacillus glennii]
MNTNPTAKRSVAANTESKEQDQYREETAAEITGPRQFTAGARTDSGQAQEQRAAGSVIGYAALALSILSLFTMPFLFGAVGIVLGYMARRRGADTIGAWAIGIGAVSIIVGVFILPFF